MGSSSGKRVFERQSRLPLIRPPKRLACWPAARVCDNRPVRKPAEHPPQGSTHATRRHAAPDLPGLLTALLLALPAAADELAAATQAPTATPPPTRTSRPVPAATASCGSCPSPAWVIRRRSCGATACSSDGACRLPEPHSTLRLAQGAKNPLAAISRQAAAAEEAQQDEHPGVVHRGDRRRASTPRSGTAPPSRQVRPRHGRQAAVAAKTRRPGRAARSRRSPVVHGGKVFFANDSDTQAALYAFDMTTGKPGVKNGHAFFLEAWARPEPFPPRPS